MEDELNSWRSLADNDINLRLLQQIMRSDNILAELNDESSTLKRLVTHVLQIMDGAFTKWQLANDPTSPEVVAAHRDVAAARIVLDWIDAHMKAGAQAEQLLEGEANEQDQET
jgi:hypothetical protein